MKKLVFTAFLALIGGAAYSTSDYLQIAGRKIGASVQQSIPLGIQIERLDLSVEQLDREIESNKRKVVEEEVSLERFAAQVEAKAKSASKLKSELASLRGKYVSSTCETTKGSLEGAMAKRVSLYKMQSEALATMEKSLSTKKSAMEKMGTSFDKQKLARDLLKNKVDSLRAEYESMKMQGQIAHTTLQESGVRKATELANALDRRLEVERRVFEESDSLNQDDDGAEVRRLTGTSNDFDLTEVELLLGEQTQVAGR